MNFTRLIFHNYLVCPLWTKIYSLPLNILVHIYLHPAKKRKGSNASAYEKPQGEDLVYLNHTSINGTPTGWSGQVRRLFFCAPLSEDILGPVSHTQDTPRGQCMYRHLQRSSSRCSAPLSFQTFICFSPPHTESAWPQASSGTPTFQTPEVSSSTPTGLLPTPRQASTNGDRS